MLYKSKGDKIMFVIFSGSSGVGKNTVINELMKNNKNIKFFVSCTTRDMRPGEVKDVNYHYFTKEEFLKMCDEYDYVAIGGIVSKEITQNEYPYFTWFINEAHKRGAKIHGLGFTNLKGLEKYKFDSVDSTSWTTGNRFGSVYFFNGKTVVKYDKKQGQRLADSKAVAVHNFNEWVKFQKYAEKNL